MGFWVGAVQAADNAAVRRPQLQIATLYFKRALGWLWGNPVSRAIASIGSRFGQIGGRQRN
jgi:hypothetical protein